LKGILNVLAALRKNRAINTSNHLFESGEDFTSKTYCYYPEKSALKKGSKSYQKIKEHVQLEISSVFGENCWLKPIELREEPHIIFFNLYSQEINKLMGSVYIRNSGTEPKTGIHVKGWQDAEIQWRDLMDRLLFYLLLTIKSPGNSLVAGEHKILELIGKHPLTSAEIGRLCPDVPSERMLHEISHYEGLIAYDGKVWSITKRGVEWLNQFLMRERNGST